MGSTQQAPSMGVPSSPSLARFVDAVDDAKHYLQKLIQVFDRMDRAGHTSGLPGAEVTKLDRSLFHCRSHADELLALLG